MIILAIDPGSTESGFVLMSNMKILDKGKINNDGLLLYIECCNYDILAIEMIASYGMAVGQSVFDTCRWIGRFDQMSVVRKKKVESIFRKRNQPEKGLESVCQYICKNGKARDSNIRQAIIDMYPETGGGKIPQIGTKKEPGPLYGVSKDIWSAIAVALTYQGKTK